MNTLVVLPHRQRKLKDVVGLAELNLLLTVSGRLEPVNDDVERPPVQRRDECLPIRRNKLGLAAHGGRERINHLFFIADILIRMSRIVEDVRRPAAWISAPAKRLLGANVRGTD